MKYPISYQHETTRRMTKEEAREVCDDLNNNYLPGHHLALVENHGSGDKSGQHRYFVVRIQNTDTGASEGYVGEKR